MENSIETCNPAGHHICCGYFFLDSQGEFLYIFSPKKQCLITSLNREVTRSDEAIQLYAILSSLSDIPIRQGIAVTGSINQKEQIQAIGGVNQKIEGFFEVCKSKGLTGKQGVIIPRANVKNLMLKK